MSSSSSRTSRPSCRRHGAPHRPSARVPSSRDGAEELVLRVGPPAHGGHCVARPVDDPAGRVVFVRHSLPGETVRAVLTERSARIWRADLRDEERGE